MLGLMGEGRVDQAQQLVVLPEADAEGDSYGDEREDQPRAQLLEVVDR